MSERPSESERTALDNRVVILNGFTSPEIIAIMNVVKSIYARTDLAEFFEFTHETLESDSANEFAKRVLSVVAAAKQLPETQGVGPGDLIFAKTTENSLQMKLADLIEDMSEDHEYLKNHPPDTSRPADGDGPDGSQGAR